MSFRFPFSIHIKDSRYDLMLSDEDDGGITFNGSSAPVLTKARWQYVIAVLDELRLPGTAIKFVIQQLPEDWRTAMCEAALLVDLTFAGRSTPSYVKDEVVLVRLHPEDPNFIISKKNNDGTGRYLISHFSLGQTARFL